MRSIDSTRRSFMSGAITSAVASSAFAAGASPALAAPAEPSPSRPTWSPANAVDEKLFELWARRDVDAADMRAASDAAESAAARMPEWSRSGPAFVEKNGSPTGDSCGWPALPLDLLTECDRCIHSVTLWPMKVRWSRDEVRAEYRRSLRASTKSGRLRAAGAIGCRGPSPRACERRSKRSGRSGSPRSCGRMRALSIVF